MPELPEVETIARTLAPQVVGKKIITLDIIYPTSVEKNTKLENCLNATIIQVKRRAKLLLIELDNEMTLAFHLKMTGALLIYPISQNADSHDRVFFHLDNQTKLVFKDIRRFGYIKLLAPDDFSSWVFWQKLGCEPLEIDADTFEKLFTKKNTKIKAALLDQSVIAGIGNIYADESLFNARIMPNRLVKDINSTEFKVLFNELQKVLKLSIEQCGSSIRDYKDANGNAGAFQNSFSVYGRKDQECKICKKAIQVAKIAGRTSSFCTNCQK